MPFWEDTEPRLSPDGSTRRLRRPRRTSGSRRRRAARRASCSRRARRSGSTTGRWWSRRARAREPTRVVDVDDPWPRRLAGDATTTATSSAATVSPDGAEIAYAFTPRADLKRTEIRVADVATGAVRALTGTPRHGRPLAGVVAGRRHARVRLGAPRLVGGAPGRRGRQRRPAAHRTTTPTSPSSNGTRTERDCSPCAGGEAASTSSPWTSRPARSRSSRRAGRGAARTGPPTATSSPPTRITPRRHSYGWSRAAAEVDPRSDAARRPLARRTCRRRRSRTDPRTASRFPGFSSGPAREQGRCRRSSTRTAARRRSTRDEWDGHAQYFLDKGYAWLAINFRGSTDVRTRLRAAEPRRLGRRRHAGLPRRRGLPAHARLGRRRAGSRSSGRATAPTWRCCPSPTTRSTATAARSASTATATSSRPGRRATARASRTWSG